MNMFHNLSRYITIEDANNNPITQYDIFNTDPLVCPSDFNTKWYGVLNKVSIIGRTKYPNIILECLGLLKAHPSVSPVLHLMTRYIDPMHRHVVFRLDPGRATRPLIAIQSNGKVRVPKCLLRVWSQSPTTRIPMLKPHDSPIRYDESGYIHDEAHKNNTFIPSKLCTPVHDISLPTHIWFKQMLQYQTIEYVDVLQAQYEPVGTSTIGVKNRYDHQTRFPLLYTDENGNEPSSNPVYKYNYCEVHQALTLSATSTLVQFIEHASAARLILASKKNKQAEAQIHHPCSPLGSLLDYTKPSFYAIYPMTGAIPEFQRMWFRRLPTSSVVLVAMSTAKGYIIDDAIAVTKNGGINTTVRRKSYCTEQPFHLGWESVKKHIEDLQAATVRQISVPRKTANRRELIRQAARQKEFSLEEWNKLNNEGLRFILDPKKNVAPVYITKKLLKKYSDAKHKNNILQKLKHDIYLDPQYNMAPVGKQVFKDHSIFSSYVIKPSEVINAATQTILNKSSIYNPKTYARLQQDMEQFKVNKISANETNPVKVDEDEDGKQHHNNNVIIIITIIIIIIIIINLIIILYYIILYCIFIRRNY
jgi:hypothetical protein